MKIFAIGGAGHVGSEVVKELLKRNAEVDVLVREKGTKVSEGANAVGWRSPRSYFPGESSGRDRQGLSAERRDPR